MASYRRVMADDRHLEADEAVVLVESFMDGAVDSVVERAMNRRGKGCCMVDG